MVFDNLLDELNKFNEGNNFFSYRFLGCKAHNENGENGYRFTVWAPRARSVSIVGDFNNWHPVVMEPVFQSGFHSIFLNYAHENQAYKYLIETYEGDFIYKIDPYAHKFETPPKDASIVVNQHDFHWEDDTWMHHRDDSKVYNIYEVHPTSWRRHYDGRPYSFDDLIESLIPYVKDMGYTHIEFMPLMDYPLDMSWGYQMTGYFSVAGLYGDTEGLKRFVNAAHKAELGVILDWVPGHFSQNHDALAYFDGTPTFEYENEIRGKNRRWGAHNFDLGKTQVQSFLISSAFYWLETFHIDGIRVDAVSNMLYLDYDEPPHILNDDGTNVNHKGVEFLRKLNTNIHQHFPNVIMVAEESTAWEGITKPVDQGGLGFDYKWNMGWMNDTLRFFEMDPLYRNKHMELLTFIFIYMRNENYILAMSHDEVVHGKKSLLDKMPGDRYNQFAQLKVLYAWMMVLVGEKLNFMGHELGQYLEWRYYEELEWHALQYEFNAEYHHYIRTLNHLYKNESELHNDAVFEVVDVDEANAILSFKRGTYLILINFLPQEHQNYLWEVKAVGTYEVVINSEMKEYGGSWEYQSTSFDTKDGKINLVVPAYGALLLRKRR